MKKLTFIDGYSKGEALLKLQPIIPQNGFSIPNLMLIKCEDWLDDEERYLNIIKAEFGAKRIAVRSSAYDEDGDSGARAGEYHSALDIPANQSSKLRSAISEVVNSYSHKGCGYRGQHFIIQDMVEKVTTSGVIFTYELNNGAPYYVINYDDISGSTSSVTAGNGENSNRILFVHRSAIDKVRSSRFNRLLKSVKNLEDIVGSSFLDIEFAIDEDLQPHLLQVRPITTKSNWGSLVAACLDKELLGVQSFVKERLKPQFGVFGETTVLGQMPDWNPAEMIGRAPRALSLSLYSRLITNDAWRLAREKMGYAVPFGQPLMVSLAGQPYIDTRLSFHSYLPGGLKSEISNKLVDSWVKCLRDQPQLHDKIEFDVAITTFSFDIDERMKSLADCLNVDERAVFREELFQLTLPLVQGRGQGSIAAALARIKRLDSTDLPERLSGLTGLNHLIEKCIRYGTVPFSMLARHGFIAITLLQSLQRLGVLDDKTVTKFQSSIQTVAGEMLQDMHSVQSGDVPRYEFIRRYGHLRPGTYDIQSPRYDQMDIFGSLFRASQAIDEDFAPFDLSAKQGLMINSLLQKEGFLGLDSDGFLDYVRSAIVAREYGKFVFTRSVSAILELIAAFGDDYGLSREDMSHIPIDTLLSFGVESGDGRSLENRLRDVADKNARRHALTVGIRLPQVLFDEAGVHVVPFQISQPNFITMLKVDADIVYLGTHQQSINLNGRIVLIENADPGYDWIFAQSIAGLVTKYGGANSHMAIRCAEFAIPAAIGCGEQRFDALLQANRLSIDCAVGMITVLH